MNEVSPDFVKRLKNIQDQQLICSICQDNQVNDPICVSGFVQATGQLAYMYSSSNIDTNNFTLQAALFNSKYGILLDHNMHK